MIVDAGGIKTKKWRSVVAETAREAMYNKDIFLCAVSLTVSFYLARPKNHYGTGSNSWKLKESAPEHHTKQPDATKLLRSTEDALTKIVWEDDAQVVEQTVKKYYTAGATGALIKIIEC